MCVCVEGGGGDMYRVVDVSYESCSCDTIETYNAQSNDILVSDTKQRSYIDMISVQSNTLLTI